MKKNVLFIVIDSVTNDVIFNKDTSKYSVPFLTELRKKSISGDRMYSEAPYTEAALMSLLGSIDTMDNGGYMDKLKGSTCVLEVFQREGYKTFFNTYYPSIYPSQLVRGYDEMKYTEGFQFMQVWEYRLKYFSDVYLNGDLLEEEKMLLVAMLEDNFKAWISYFEKILKKDHETSMIYDCIDLTGMDKDLKRVLKEYNDFCKNKTVYLEKLLTLRENHQLFKIKTYMMVDKVHNDEVRNMVMNNYKDVFKKIAKIDFTRNIIYNRFPFKKTIKSLFKRDFKTVKGLLAGYKNSLFDKDLYERIAPNYDLLKNERSFYTISHELMNWIKKNKNTNWMSYVHIDDVHFNEMFFTWDTDNIDIINNDFERARNYLNKVPKKYKGSVAYDLALSYCDNIIKNIFDFLEKEKLIDNTSVVITADHGFSYYFCPVREKCVNSCYRENYNVPFIIYDKDIKPRKINKYLATKDIPSTLLSLAGIKIPNEFKGKNLIKFEGRDYALIEYMGGGCPDVRRRPIVLGVRTNNYDVIIDAYINRKFEDNELKEVYDINKDPFEHNNLAKRKQIKVSIEKELAILKKRFDELTSEYNKQ